MAKFNKTKFAKQAFEERTKDIEVDALFRWFDLADEELAWMESWVNNDQQGKVNMLVDGVRLVDCLWRVRGLTGSEVARVLEVEHKNKTLGALVEAISGSSDVKRIKEAIGVSDDTPNDIAKRLEQLVFGSVEPVIAMDTAVKLAEKFPIEFYTLTNEISKLTGLGMDIKK